MKKYIFMFFIGASMVACGSKDGGSTSGVDAGVPVPPMYQGTWTSTCNRVGTINGITAYAVEQDSIQGTSYVNTRTTYSQSGCASGREMFQETVTGSLKLVGEDTAVPGASRVQMTPTAYSMRLLTNSMVNQYNQERHCDITNWTLSVPVNLVGTKCGFAANNIVINDILKVEGSRLYSGDASSCGVGKFCLGSQFPTRLRTNRFSDKL